mgnify:CR=1 FL=1
MFFAYAPSFSGIVESFLTQTPSKYYLEAITDSTFLRIPYAKHTQLIKAHRELETLFRKITEHRTETGMVTTTMITLRQSFKNK